MSLVAAAFRSVGVASGALRLPFVSFTFFAADFFMISFSFLSPGNGTKDTAVTLSSSAIRS